MQIFSFIKRNFVTGAVLFFISAFLFGQAKMPDMPDMPSMPGITMPQLGDAFYTPNIPPRNPAQKTDDSENKTDEKEGDKNQAVLKDGLTTDDLIKRMFSGSDYTVYGPASSLSKVA